ncbi:MAG: di-trans,poly-cis-decaprenylcistransferase [Gemmatimonadota bacterium]|nr:di-trans,poly-cis-decaprenylcistransferase [Gemmatimonadota bacterium]
MPERFKTQSIFAPPPPEGLHVAIIMDGNGRWASQRGWPRAAGHRTGAQVVRRVVEAAPDVGIGTLTLYAFSSDNWGRPPREVGVLMRLFRAYLLAETQRCVENGVEMRVIGRRDRLPPVLLRAIDAAESATRGGRKLHLRIALDYSARDAILTAASRLGEGEEPSREEFSRLLGEAVNSPDPLPDVDLLIRTGGEQRLSDYLLWECAYAELSFPRVMWPDFGTAELERAVRDFHSRERRFGRLPQAVAG